MGKKLCQLESYRKQFEPNHAEGHSHSRPTDDARCFLNATLLVLHHVPNKARLIPTTIQEVLPRWNPAFHSRPSQRRARRRPGRRVICMCSQRGEAEKSSEKHVRRGLVWRRWVRREKKRSTAVKQIQQMHIQHVRVRGGQMWVPAGHVSVLK